MASWSTPERLSSYANQASNPVVAVNATGYAISVWSENSGDNLRIRAALRPSEGDWSCPVNLSLYCEDGFNPVVAMNATGNIIVAWESYEGLTTKINVKIKAFGGIWSDVMTVSDACIDSINPRVTIDNIGNATVVWESYDEDCISIQAARRTFFGIWTKPEMISSEEEYSFQPEVASSPNGNVIAVWTAFDGCRLNTQAATLENCYWTCPICLSDYFSDAINPQVSMSASGDALAAWTALDGSNYLVQTALKFAGDNWIGPMTISEVGQDAYNPQVAMDASGNVVSTWTKYNGSNFTIQSSSLYVNYSATSQSIYWTDPVNLSSTSVDVANAKIAVDPSGNAVAVWTKLNGPNFILQASTLAFGSSWTPAVDISNKEVEAVSPNLVLDSNGNAIIVWAENYSNYVIQAIEGTHLFDF
jgi:hypothetical protein